MVGKNSVEWRVRLSTEDRTVVESGQWADEHVEGASVVGSATQLRGILVLEAV